MGQSDNNLFDSSLFDGFNEDVDDQYDDQDIDNDSPSESHADSDYLIDTPQTQTQSGLQDTTTSSNTPTHWRGIVGQMRIQRIFSRAVRTGRIAHAYLLWGATGIGKDALALQMATILNCSQTFVANDLVHACGRCSDCVQASRIEHPNISLIFSLPTGKASGVADSASPLLKMSDEQITVIREQIHRKAENPYHRIDIPGATLIRINAIRDLKRSLSLAQSTQGKRVIIITDAESMNAEAANTFLKTLEEPSQDALFILTTSQKERVLPTILSRCQQVRCSTLAEEEIMAGLLQRFDMTADHARALAQLSEGSFARALSLIDEDTQSLNTEMMEWLRALLRKHSYQIATADLTQSFTEKKDRTFVEKLLTTLLYFLRAAYPIALQHQQCAISPATDIERFAVNFYSADYERAMTSCEHAIRLLKLNANLHILLLDISLKLRACFLR